MEEDAWDEQAVSWVADGVWCLRAYRMTVVPYSTRGSIVSPLRPVAFDISNVARSVQMFMNICIER